MSHVSALTPGAHIRDHRSFLADAEKRLLIALARRMPTWVNSDHLSALGLLAMLMAGASFALMAVTPAAAWGVVGFLALNWFGDSLDGTLARVRGHQRPRYGYYVDHVIDVAGTTALMGGLALSGLMQPTLALGVLVAYLLVSAESYLGTHAAGVFRMSFLGFGPTELRILLMIGAIKGAQSAIVSPPFIGPAKLFDIGGVCAVAGMVVAFIVSSVQTTRHLYRAEPLPNRAPARNVASGVGA